MSNSNTISIEDASYQAGGTNVNQYNLTDTQTIPCDKDGYLVGKLILGNYNKDSDTDYTFYTASSYLKHYNASGVLIETLVTVSNFRGYIKVVDGVAQNPNTRFSYSSFFTSVSKGDYLELSFTAGNGLGSHARQAEIQGYWIYNK